MKTSNLFRLVLTVWLAALGVFSSLPAAENAAGILPSVPIISLRATVPETREPFCDPAICDAAPPPPGVFVISRHGGNLATELFVFLTYEGTASNGVDYAALPHFVSFRAGASTVELFVEGAYDQRAEGDETVVARLQPDPSLGPMERYRLDPVQSVERAVIHDNEAPVVPVVSIKATSPIAEETSHPYRRLPLRGLFTIARTGPTNDALPVFVHYGGTATAGVDYPALPWLVSIPAGANHVELEVVPNIDGLAEPIEILEAQLSQCPPLTDPPMGIPCYLVNIDPARATARVFLRDDGITTASLELTAPRDGAEFSAGQTIRLAATAIDLEGAITHVEFFAADTKIGESQIFFIVQPEPGTPIYHEFEWTGVAVGQHELTARAVNAAGLRVVSPPVQIKVSDGRPVVSVVATDPFAREGTNASGSANTATFVVTRTGPTNAALAVHFSLGGTALVDVDYPAPDSPLIIPVGERRARLVITPRDDHRAEPIETVVVTLAADDATLASYTLGFPHRAAVIIVDHDHRRPPCLRLPDGLFNFCLPVASGDCFRVEVTRNFRTWTPLCTVPANEGHAHFVDPDAPALAHRFYRFVPVPCEP